MLQGTLLIHIASFWEFEKGNQMLQCMIFHHHAHTEGCHVGTEGHDLQDSPSLDLSP